MKKIKFGCMVLGCTLSVLSLSSCIRQNTTIGRDLSYTWSDSTWVTLQKNMSDFEEALTKSNSVKVVSLWNSINAEAYNIATYRTIENVNYAAYGSEEAYQKYLYFSSILSQIMEWEEGVYSKIYESKYKDDFFKDMTEEEIDKLIHSKKPERYYELESDNEAILKRYQDLDSDTLTYTSEVSELYVSLVKNYNEEATLLGSTNYMEYAYENVYTREYSPSDVENFNTFVKKYIVPALAEYKNDLAKKAQSLTRYQKLQIEAFNSDKYQNNYDSIKEFATFMGGEYLNNYSFLRSEGIIVNGTANAAIDGAFTTYLYAESLNQPMMYFGPSYQNTMTFVHEFGHYNAFRVNGAGSMSYDLAETQSQGSEMLYMLYLKNENKQDSAVMDYLIEQTVYEGLATITMASMVNAFEYKVYNATNLEAKNLQSMYEEAADELGGYDKIMNILYGNGSHKDYWTLVALENPCYYISYAMAYVPVLELYATGKSDIATAKNQYELIYNPKLASTEENTISTTDFLKILNAAGMYTPFEEDAYKNILLS